MTRPNILVRFAGSPLGAVFLFAVYIAIGLGWHEGVAPWWLALGAVGAALRTWRSIRHMQAYKRWRAEWQAMGEDDTPPSAPSKPRRYGFIYLLGAAALLVIPMSLGQLHNAQQSNVLIVLWLVIGFVMFIAFCRIVLRHWKHHSYRKAGAEPVAWMLGRASSAPSRKAACKALPAYVIPLLNGSKGKQRPKTIDAATT